MKKYVLTLIFSIAISEQPGLAIDYIHSANKTNASVGSSRNEFVKSVMKLQLAASKIRQKTWTGLIVNDAFLRSVAGSYVRNVRIFAHTHRLLSLGLDGTEWISKVRQEYLGKNPLAKNPIVEDAEKYRKWLTDFAGEEAVVKFEKSQEPPDLSEAEALYLVALKKRPSGWTTEIDDWNHLETTLQEYSSVWNQYASHVADFTVERARYGKSWARRMSHQMAPVGNDAVQIKKLRAQLVDFADENAVEEYESFVKLRICH